MRTNAATGRPLSFQMDWMGCLSHKDFLGFALSLSINDEQTKRNKWNAIMSMCFVFFLPFINHGIHFKLCLFFILSLPNILISFFCSLCPLLFQPKFRIFFFFAYFIGFTRILFHLLIAILDLLNLSFCFTWSNAITPCVCGCKWRSNRKWIREKERKWIAESVDEDRWRWAAEKKIEREKDEENKAANEWNVRMTMNRKFVQRTSTNK